MSRCSFGSGAGPIEPSTTKDTKGPRRGCTGVSDPPRQRPHSSQTRLEWGTTGNTTRSAREGHRFLGTDSPFAFSDVTATVVGMAGDQAKHEPAEREGAESEEAVADHAHPAELVHATGVEEFRRACVPRAVLDGGPGLHDADRQHADQDHQRETDVDGPEGEGQRGILPSHTRTQSAEAEQHEAETQHAVDTE